MGKKTVLIPLLLLPLLSFILTGCARNAPQSDVPMFPVDNGVLRVHLGDEPNTLDPARAYSMADFMLLPAIHRGLFALEKGGEQPQADLVKSWEVSDDGLRYTFVLLPEAKFSNGQTVASDDVKFSWERMLNPSTKSPWAYLLQDVAGAEDYQRRRKTTVEGIQVTDPSSLVVTLRRPLPDFKLRLAHPALAIVSRANVTAWGAIFATPRSYLDSAPRMVVSGPLVPMEWVGGAFLSLAKNNYYPVAASNRLEIDFAGDPSTVLTEWRQRYWDLIQGRKKEFLEENLNAASSDDLWQLTYLQFQDTIGIWNDFRLRLAMSFALDREVLAASAPQLVRPTNDLLPNTNGNLVIKNWNTSLELVQLAGFEGVETLPQLALAYAAEADLPLAEQIAGQLTDFGFKVSILPPGQLSGAQVVLKSRSFVGVDFEEWIRFFDDQASPEVKPQGQLVTELVGTGKVIPLFFQHQVWLVNDEVRGFSLNEAGIPDWARLKK